MNQFAVTLFNGHPIITEGEKTILIDTGSPTTIHTAHDLDFCAREYRCSTNYMGLTAGNLSEMLGTEITTLLGTDVLAEYSILFDYKNKVVQFAEEKIDLEGTEVSIGRFMGIPIVELHVADEPLRFFLDTGARLSYLSENITQHYQRIGSEEDFYPGVGKFRTDCFTIPTRFGSKRFVARYGNLPALLQTTLMLGGTDGIIGFDFFMNFSLVLDLKNNRLTYA